MKTKLENLEKEIKKTDKLSEEHKEQALGKIKEWYIEDKAEGLLGKELLKITKEIAPMLEEIGLE